MKSKDLPVKRYISFINLVPFEFRVLDAPTMVEIMLLAIAVQGDALLTDSCLIF
jgi:hypothetical protein